MFGISLSEILVIALVALIFLGPEHLPDITRKIARIYRNFLEMQKDFSFKLLMKEELSEFKKEDGKPKNE